MRPAPQALETTQGSVSHVETGSGRARLFLVHGLGARWQVFGPLISLLREDWRVHALDLRGHGRSGRVPGGYTVEGFTDDVLAVWRRAVAQPAVLFGHSLGGLVALRLAAVVPEAVRAVIVGDAPLFPRDIDAEAVVSYLSGSQAAVRSMAASSLRQVDPEIAAYIRAPDLRAPHDAGEWLSEVRCPVLLLQGDPRQGAVMNDDDVERALGLLAQPAHVRLDGVGHGLHVEAPDLVAEALTSFAADVWAAPRPRCVAAAGGDTRGARDR